MLYIGTGDGGGAYDLPENAQNKNVLLGKLLRIDPRRNGDKPYSIPSDNPFVGGNGKPEIYSYGLRNLFRFSFDSKTGMLIIGDVGQDRYEEVRLRVAQERERRQLRLGRVRGEPPAERGTRAPFSG